MSKVGIACCFRHHPEEDGPSIIQGSTVQTRPDMDAWARHASPDCPPIFPRIGFLCGYDGSHTRWSFVKYEPPQQWSEKSGYRSRGANISTCSVGSVTCADIDRCGWHGYYPLKGGIGEKMTCPWCGRPGADTIPVKIPSENWEAMLGDLRKPLEDAAKAAYESSDEVPFEFPQTVIGGPTIEPSDRIDPYIQGKAQEKGVGLRPLEDIPGWMELRQYPRGSVFLGIIPGVVSGVIDGTELRDGKRWNRGCVQYYAKLKFPEAAVPTPFGTCKF